MEKADVRHISLRTKIMIVICTSLVIVSVVLTGISIAVYRKTIIKEHKTLAQGTANIAASVIDGDRVDEYLEMRGAAEGYDETKQLLEEILDSSTDITYLYVYRFEEDGAHVVFDLDSGDTPAMDIASVIPFDEGYADRVGVLLAGGKVEPVITNDAYGHLLTAYEPVYDSRGRCVCYTCADVDMQQLTLLERSFFVEMTTVFLGFFILLCVLVIWLTRFSIILPVNSITKWVDAFSASEDTQEALDEDVKMFRRLDIHTGDEIEKLYRSLCSMILGEAEQMRSIRKLSDSTVKMQDGLIVTMADMVENRDSDTGAHIQKTAAYVKIIVEGLKAKGYYAEKITPKFMSDVVRSAPLHDVGKINIPDGVLNKPGKLTDEEYEIMKTHTIAGKKIMENAISTVEGENYLKEARNMAAYHHERWDGKGYPEGLHGEVIPLSARIMAVADVFDALSSPRVYKPAFPIEKALSIIEEGKGTQFDPKCVEVFIDSLAEVKVILTKYNQDA
ncbi:MAG: HD domain-containing protein, partial [Lachnospiraceae bacterium]|nr:HD domain-containing protein [Lachnospiraceae bacterium]